MNERALDHRKMVTEAMIKHLEEGTAPWQRDWSVEGGFARPINATTREPYNGGNAMWLLMSQMDLGMSDNRFVTFNQAARMREGTYEQLSDKEFEANKKLRLDDPKRVATWRVRKGVHGFPIEKWIIKDASDDDGGGSAGDGRKRRTAFVRHYTVFHASQVDGMPPLAKHEVTWDPVESAERIVRGSGVQIIEGGVQPAYSPSRDVIMMPERGRFPDSESYYATELHELGHSTAHPSRWPPRVTGRSPESFVKRDLYDRSTDSYAREELFVEIASMYVCADLAIKYDTSRHASYVQGWIKHLRSDPNALFEACRGAQDIANVLRSYELKLELSLGQQIGEPEQERARKAPRIEVATREPALGIAL